MEPRVFELLCFLLENRDRLVTKDEIFAHVWNGRIVSESALSSQIKAVRKVIGDDGRTQALVRTVHGKGFRFIGDVEVVGQVPAEALLAPAIAPLEPITPDRPSIAVMPFDNLSGDPDQGFSLMVWPKISLQHCPNFEDFSWHHETLPSRTRASTRLLAKLLMN